MPSGIKTNGNNSVKLVNSMTVKLDGQGAIMHVVDDQGSAAIDQGHSQYECSYSTSNPLEVAENFLY